jgi:phosphatidylglycerophosphatase A
MENLKALFQKINSPGDFLAVIIASGLGSGFSPKGPGTAGTLIAVPLVFFSSEFSEPTRALLWTSVFLLGLWSSARFEFLTKKSDNQTIVIDEVLGYAVTTFFYASNWKALGLGFVLFRIFDIFKPWPVRLLDRRSKTAQSLWARAFFVIADDLAAGVLAAMVLAIADHFFGAQGIQWALLQ